MADASDALVGSGSPRREAMGSPPPAAAPAAETSSQFITSATAVAYDPTKYLTPPVGLRPAPSSGVVDPRIAVINADLQRPSDNSGRRLADLGKYENPLHLFGGVADLYRITVYDDDTFDIAVFNPVQNYAYQATRVPRASLQAPIAKTLISSLDQANGLMVALVHGADIEPYLAFGRRDLRAPGDMRQFSQIDLVIPMREFDRLDALSMCCGWFFSKMTRSSSPAPSTDFLRQLLASACTR